MKKLLKSHSYILTALIVLASCDSSDDNTVPIQIDDTDQSALGNQLPETGYEAPSSYMGYILTWSDEFDGNSLNLNNWNYETGNTDPFGNIGWGNNELQLYGRGNVSVDNGYLTIEAREESNGSFTSGRINSRDKQEYQYGRIDIRAALPNQRGMWPAIWMLGENHLEIGWPACGEIDIMEAFIAGPETANQIKSNAFWGNSFPAPNAPSPPYKLSSGDFSEQWHVFSLEWEENNLKFFVDGSQHYELIINEELGAHFRNEFFFIMNVAVGGNPVPSPDASTVFPQRMFVDYVRVYQKN
ncbi:MAG: glycoside hydrolase family 16 protein [Bacteroidota bacterium]